MRSVHSNETVDSFAALNCYFYNHTHQIVLVWLIYRKSIFAWAIFANANEIVLQIMC